MFAKLFHLALIAAATIGPQSDRIQIKRTFDVYKKSILENKGATAVQWVDRLTLAYFDEMRKLALEGSADKVRSQRISDQLMTLMLRSRMTRDQLAAMDARALFTHAVDQGWVGKESVGSLEVGEVNVTGEAAQGRVVVGGKPAPMFFRFEKEDGLWKIDLTSIMPHADLAFQQIARQQDITPEALVIQLMEMANGEAFDPNLWNPPKAQSP